MTMNKFMLIDALCIAHDRGIDRTIILSLSLPESKGTAEIEIHISPNWKLYPPRVLCKEPWIKRDIDWHIYSDGRLCYIYDGEWIDQVQSVRGMNEQDRLLYPSSLLFLNVTYLLDRHCLSEQLGITEWTWPARPHGKEKAEREYRCQLKKNQPQRPKAQAGA